MKRLELFLMMLHIPVDFVMLMLAATLGYMIRMSAWATALRPVQFALPFPDYLEISFWVALAWMLLYTFAGLYSTDPNRKFGTDLVRVVYASAAGLAGIALFLLFRAQSFDSRFLVLGGSVLAVVLVSVGRLVLRSVKSICYRLGFGLRRVVVIGNDQTATSIIRELSARRELGYAIVGTFDAFLGNEKKIHTHAPEEILYTNPRRDEQDALALIDFCNSERLVCKYTADLFSTYTSHTNVSALAGIPVLELKPTQLDGWGRVWKRVFDIAVSVVVLVLCSPLFLIVAVCVAIDSGLPVFYKNERVGKNNHPFFALKFRSMYQKYCTGPQFPETRVEAEAFERDLIKKQNTKTGPIYKIGNDPRVTRVGVLLRRLSLDELPQFWNVLVGDMSIVGPRPHQPREVGQYEARNLQVLAVRPGITGLAQISGRSDLSFADEMRLDVLYLERWSAWQDVIIFLKTPFILFKKRRVV